MAEINRNDPITITNIDSTPTEASGNLITSGGVKQYVDEQIKINITNKIGASY